MNPSRNLTVAGAIAATAILAACSGAPTPATSSGRAPSSAPSTAATTGQPAPRVTESNPPGDIPDNTAYVAFSPAGGGYSVKIPEGWARTSGGTTTSFTDKLNHIEVSKAAAPSQPTLASVTNTDVAGLKGTVPKFAMGKVSTVVRHGGTAILATYQGDSAPDQVTGKVVQDAFERYTFYLAGLTRLELLFAVLLAASAGGIVLALGLAERRRSLAILSVLGARRAQLRGLALSEGLLITIGGLIGGGLIAWGLSQMLVKVLTGVFDPPPSVIAVPWGYLSITVVAVAAAMAVAAMVSARASTRPAVEELRDL